MKSLTFVEIDVPGFANPGQTVTFRFAEDTSYLPAEFDAIPSLRNVSFSPATISLGKDLGQRASITASFTDHKHVFACEPFHQGSFWGKFRGRYGTKLRGRPFRLIRGLAGQSLAEMDVRHYIIETVDGPTPAGVYTIEAKDVLKLADNDRAQAPLLSNGRLAGSISAAQTTAILAPAGIGNAEYPASGFVCFGGKEVCAFTRAGDTLTLTRAQFGSDARGHDSGDRAQLVLRYTGNDVAQIIADLLTNYAGVDPAYIPLAEWQAETASHLDVIYAATITEPMAVRTLLSELIEQAALALWWDDRAKLVRLRVLREIATDAQTFDEETIIEGSLQVKEQPESRISQIWTYYGQRDATDQADNSDNYRAALATVDLEREAAYGLPAIRKITGRWVQTQTAATRLNSIQMSRFRDPPRAFSFALFRDQAVQLAGGYQLRWWANQNQAGILVPAKIQVRRIRPEADYIHVEAEEMLASGVIVLVNVVFLTTTGGVLSWLVPSNWNNADNSFDVIGAGAGGGADDANGGGGAYSRAANVPLTPGALISYRVAAGGQGAANHSGFGQDGEDSWFGAPTFAAALVAAKGGTAGGNRTSGTGGQAAAGIGAVRFSGGNGGLGAPEGEERSGGGGGGGAAGPNGNGAPGGNNTSVNDDAGAGGGGADGGAQGGDAGNGTPGNGGHNRFNFGGGSGSSSGDEGGGGGGGYTSNDGGPGGSGEQLWTQTVSPIIAAGPGGGGGGGGTKRNGGHGGFYGGGGGGAGEDGRGGNGSQGIIAISWREGV
jgi:hypothetical protein